MVIVSHTLPDFFGIGENRSQRCQQDNSTIKIKDKQIKPVNTNRFVGFELDSKLNWKSHITSKCQATQRLINAQCILSPQIRRYPKAKWFLECNEEKYIQHEKT